MVSNDGILYIEPSASTSGPIIDPLTRKMTAAFRQGQSGPCYRGFHVCACGVFSGNADYRLPGGEHTNSLCVHYLAFHRAEVPEAQLRKVAALACGEEEPNAQELSAPTRGGGRIWR